jgi:hypothetical protein
MGRSRRSSPCEYDEELPQELKWAIERNVEKYSSLSEKGLIEPSPGVSARPSRWLCPVLTPLRKSTRNSTFTFR